MARPVAAIPSASGPGIPGGPLGPARRRRVLAQTLNAPVATASSCELAVRDDTSQSKTRSMSAVRHAASPTPPLLRQAR